MRSGCFRSSDSLCGLIERLLQREASSGKVPRCRLPLSLPSARWRMNTHSNNLCDNCGICCLAFSLPPFDANELVKASDELLQKVDAYARSARYRNSHPCLWLDLDSGKCKHYEVRPVLCRWFEPGSLACNKLRIKVGLPNLQSKQVSS